MDKKMRFLLTVKMNLLQLVTGSKNARASLLDAHFFKTHKFLFYSLWLFELHSHSITFCIFSTNKGSHLSLVIFQVFVKFLFHVVEMTAVRVNTVTRCSFVNLDSPSDEVFLLKLFGCMLTCLTHLLKSGLLLYRL